MSEKKGGERRCGGAEEEERTDNFWIQSSRNPTPNFVHPLGIIRAVKQWTNQYAKTAPVVRLNSNRVVIFS
ncbi:MAG: hypothetical protein F6K41_26410 [Symploca sp. SIO3E6]|nr:hypothetical protein [Caldora sp. SIO3E6]